MRKIAVLALVLALVPATAALADLSRREEAQIKQRLAKAFEDGAWGQVPGLFEELAAANDKGAFEIMVQVAERAPSIEAEDVARGLRRAALRMDDRRVRREVGEQALDADAPEVRRNLLIVAAEHEDWETLIEALDDEAETCAAVAAWRLIDNEVEQAVIPMIERMEELDGSQEHIWDVYRNGLGQLLGKRLNSGAGYRSLWKTVRAQGGLDSVEPAERAAGDEDGAGGSSVRLFGREIECTRVVFILDVSGSMETIDPNQADPAGRSRTRGRGPESERRERPKGKTRLERAQIALKKVIEGLPDHYEVNILAYSSPHRIKVWRAPTDRRRRPVLHELDEESREEACAFVDGFTAGGTTATDEALVRGYDVENARCFYLLSDGFATHDGKNEIPTSEILGVIDEHGGERHIAVHTMGFQGADVAMMQAVAEHTGGSYSDIE